ncbi:Hypothetical predicted protein, partial [Mytilus galloprovincialis]
KKKQERISDNSRIDYVGNQDIAMPIGNIHRAPNIHVEMNRNNQYHGITGGLSSISESKNSDIDNASNESNTKQSKYTCQHNNKRNHVSNNASAVLDKTKETAFFPNSMSPVNNYLVLDPNETGFNRSEGPEKMNGSYELAQPIHHIDHSKDSRWNRKTSNDVYAHSMEGMYDSSNDNRHKESESNIYSRAVDNVYDSSCHTRKNGETEDNYDHFTGKKTDDDYDISQI